MRVLPPASAKAFENTEGTVLNQKPARSVHIAHDINDPSARNNDRVSRKNIDVVLGIFRQVRRQLKLNLPAWISAVLDGHVAARLVGEPPRRRDQVEKAAIANRWIGPGTAYLSYYRDGLRGGFVHENGNVRAADKASILQPLLINSCASSVVRLAT